MTKIQRIGLLLVVGLLFSSAAFSQKQSVDTQSADFLGSFSNGVYRNDFFGFRLNVPAEMHVLTAEEKSTFKDRGAKSLSEGVDGNKAAWEKAATAEVVIFSTSLEKPGSGPTASLNVGALRQPNGVTAKMVCDVGKDFLLRNPTISLVSDTTAVKIGMRDFSRVEFRIKQPEITAEIRYYATIVNGHSITFVVTYLKKEELDRFEKVLATVEFS